jgi:hypothetical protein
VDTRLALACAATASRHLFIGHRAAPRASITARFAAFAEHGCTPSERRAHQRRGEGTAMWNDAATAIKVLAGCVLGGCFAVAVIVSTAIG